MLKSKSAEDGTLNFWWNFSMASTEGIEMAFILGVGRKTARQPQGRFAANFWFFNQPWGIRNDLESIRKCFSFGKIRNLEKNITWDYSRGYQFPVFRSRPEVENMTLLNLRVNSIDPQSFIQIGPRVSEILQPTPKMNAVLPMNNIISMKIK